MKVKALVAHDNAFGVREGAHKYHKPVGTVYEIADEADAQALIDSDIVSKASEPKAGKGDV